MNKIIAILITALLLVGGGAYVKTHKQDSDKQPTQATSTTETSYKQETSATESVGQKTEQEDEDRDENDTDDNEGRTSASKETIKPTTKPATQTGATFTLAQIGTHNNSTSCYTAIAGGVYDLTAWINQHPGGRMAILSLCGKDGTQSFMNQHGGQGRPEQELASFKIGTLIK